jgi:hypothetical protein
MERRSAVPSTLQEDNQLLTMDNEDRYLPDAQPTISAHISSDISRPKGPHNIQDSTDIDIKSPLIVIKDDTPEISYFVHPQKSRITDGSNYKKPYD